MILLFVGNIYLIATRHGKDSPNPGHAHEHGSRHQDDTSQEHTAPKFETPPYVSIIIPLYNQLQYHQREIIVKNNI
jgi:hypothetical protein